MNFSDAIKHEGTKTYTENRAMAYSTTDDSLVDLFGLIGALRPRTEEEIIDKFAAAFNENQLLATKMLFYAGDVREGLGERRTFRIILKWMALNYPEIVIHNLGVIPFYNRWDSVFVLFGTPVQKDMLELVRGQLKEDIDNCLANKPISLLAKWMPSINTSSEKTRQMAIKLCEALGFLSFRQYRKTLSKLREHLRVVERSMSLQEWENIEYSAVPSYAMSHYNHAFGKHDFERFNAYIASLNKGETKINASVLYPYDLTKEYMERRVRRSMVVEQQWKALPNYVGDDANVLIMADVSGSMSGRPMETSVGLAIYFAERNNGPFSNVYMTFTGNPHFVTLNPNDTLEHKVRQVMNTDVGYNTNLEAAFDKILATAIYENVPPESLPQALVVISDMQIDPYFHCGEKDNLLGKYRETSLDFVASMKKKFAHHGYELPKLVLWNVEARRDTFLTKSNDVLLVSGQSASTFKNLVGNLDKTAYELMVATLESDRYSPVIF